MNIIKRNGTEELFHLEKIKAAVKKANESVDPKDRISPEGMEQIITNMKVICEGASHTLNVEEIQDLVENQLMNSHAFAVARNYITYRYKRAMVRKSNTTDQQILSLIECENEEVKQENSNKNPVINSTQRDYMAGEVSKDLCERFLVPSDVWEAHKEGIIHFHDSDYFAQKMTNCCLINLEDMLQNGTMISDTLIEKPKSFLTACNIATQVVAQVASSQFGGQTISLSHLASFVDVSRKKIRKMVEKELRDIPVTEEQIFAIVDDRLRQEIKQGIQTLQYQVITLMTTNGQAPFVTIFMYLNEVKDSQTKADLALLIEEMLKQRILGVKNEKGVYITPAFPKLIYVLEEDNVYEGTPYWYLTKLAAKCTAKRMVPDYISEKIMKQLKDGNCYPCMGCRSFLTVYHDENNEPKFYGRFNQGVVTINLVDVACSSDGDMGKFWKIFEERLQLCRKALMCRHEHLKGTRSDVAPILWQHGAYARLKPGEKIDKLLYNGYSTISLGYAGLYECTRYMTGKSHTDETVGMPFALSVMQYMNDACAKWREETGIAFSLYGTPLESTTYKFAKCLQRRFGVIPEVTDHPYITNSYHINVREEIDAFTKLSLEAKFQALSPGGAISYVEVPNMQNNIPAVLALLQHIYHNIMYAELNTKSDYCQVCGFDGEIRIVPDKNGKLVWECPNCKNRDQTKMNVARRTCGYIGSHFWNQGRTAEIRDRVMHL